MGVNEETIGEWNNKGMTTATIKVENRFNGADHKNTTVTQDKTSGPWDLSVAKEKNPTKQAKLTANTADHTSANLTKLSQKYSG